MTTTSIHRTIITCLLMTGLWAEQAIPADLSGLTGNGAIWEANDRVLLIAPQLWSSKEGNWRSVLTYGSKPDDDALKSMKLLSLDGTNVLKFADYYQNQILPKRPHVVVWMAGWRNAWYAEDWHKDGMPSADQLATAIEGGIALLRERGAVVLLVTPARGVPGATAGGRDSHMQVVAEAVRTAGRRSDTVVVDYFSKQQEQIDAGVEIIESEGRLTGDGHRLLANMIATGLGEALGAVPFEVDLPGGGVEKGQSVAIGLRRCHTPSAIEIRYTLDGEEPDKKAKVYRKPLKISKPTTITVLATNTETGASVRAQAEYLPLRARKADKVVKAHLGLIYEVYSLPSRPEAMPDFSTLEPAASGTWPALSFDFAADNVDVPDLRENWAVVWRGAIDVPVDGVYTFYLRSDDGSQLLMDDEVVVDHDGNHSMREQAKGMIALDRGPHEFELRYYQGNGGSGLELWWSSADFFMTKVPQTSLVHSESDIPKDKKKR